jgi:tRNA1(Val) A37 N6-methylase TrmN6
MKSPVDASQNSVAAGELTDDAFLGGQLRLLQPARGYRAGLDAVLLAAAVDAESAAGGRLLDVGAGVGVVGLCAVRRIQGLHATLLEREAELCALAGENIRRNGLGARACVISGDVGAKADMISELGLDGESFTHVVANPPFRSTDAGTRSRFRLKAGSHAHEPGISLDDWGRFLARMAAPGGTVYMVHKAEALGEVLACLKARFGGVRILPLHPRDGEPASRIIVKAAKGSRAAPTLLPGISLHGDGQAFRPQIEAVLRQGDALEGGL